MIIFQTQLLQGKKVEGDQGASLQGISELAGCHMPWDCRTGKHRSHMNKSENQRRGDISAGI